MAMHRCSSIMNEARGKSAILRSFLIGSLLSKRDGSSHENNSGSDVQSGPGLQCCGISRRGQHDQRGHQTDFSDRISPTTLFVSQTRFSMVFISRSSIPYSDPERYPWIRSNSDIEFVKFVRSPSFKHRELKRINLTKLQLVGTYPF
jgi:hypothetical protein